MTATNLESVAGDTFFFHMYVFNQGVQVDITGATVKFTAKRHATDLDAAAVVQLSTGGNGITLSDPVNGVIDVIVPPEATAALGSDAIRLLWDAQLTKGGATYTFASGQWLVRPAITLT